MTSRARHTCRPWRSTIWATPGSGSGSLANLRDLGHRIENVVYLELLRRHRTVHIGKVGSTEVDFYTPDPESDHYYQVSLTVMDEKTLARELHPLQSIDDNHPKTLLTMDRIG